MDARDEKRIGRMAVHGAAGVLFAAVFIMAGGMQAPAVFAGAAGRAEHIYQAPKTVEQQRVFDQAGLFSEDEEKELEERIQKLQKVIEADIALVSTEDAQGKTAEQYADYFYHVHELGRGEDYSGVLFLMDMDNRELYISTCGGMIRLLTDERIDSMLDHGISYMKDQDYAQCARQLLTDTRHWYQKGIAEGQYNEDRDTGEVSQYQGGRRRSIRWYEFILAAGVAAFCGAGGCGKVKRDYAMEQERRQASGFHMAYRADACFRYRSQSDVLNNSYVARQIIPRNPPSGHSGHSGHLGRSTTHKSSGGRSYGGGGRKF